MSKYLNMLLTLSSRNTPTSSTLKTPKRAFEGFEGEQSRGVSGQSCQCFDGEAVLTTQLSKPSMLAPDRRRFENTIPWRWPEDLNDAISISKERNKAAEKRKETARYCICGELAENEWTASRGRLWICEPCCDDGLLEKLQQPTPLSLTGGVI